jgi:hypothetical protein
VAYFITSPDDLFSNGKNFLHTDYSTVSSLPLRKREYFQWDLDSAFKARDPSLSIYRQGKRSLYEEFIINENTFKDQYTDIMRYLVENVFIVSALQADIDAIESSIGTALAADPYNALPDPVEEYFEDLKQFVVDRHANVLDQLPPAAP